MTRRTPEGRCLWAPRELTAAVQRSATRKRPHRAAFAEAKVAGVERIVFTGLVGAGNAGDNGLLRTFEDAENALAESGTPSVVLRNGIYLELRQVLLGKARELGKVTLSAADTPVSWISRQDIASFAFDVLLDAQAEGIFDVVGPSMASLPEIVSLVGQRFGQPLAYEHLEYTSFLEFLTASGMPKDTSKGKDLGDVQPHCWSHARRKFLDWHLLDPRSIPATRIAVPCGASAYERPSYGRRRRVVP